MYSLVTHAVYKCRNIAENIHYPRYTQAHALYIFLIIKKYSFLIMKKKYTNRQVPVQRHLFSI